MSSAVINGNGNRNENGDRNGTDADQNRNSKVLDIYPLNSYYFGYKDAAPVKHETLPDRLRRMKANYDAHGLRTSVQAVMLVPISAALPSLFTIDITVDSSAALVELFNHPHLLLLQFRNSVYNLPGGRLRPRESEIDGLKRKLSSKLSLIGDGTAAPDWQVGECLGMWWRPGFETLLYPYLPPNIKRPKECTKLFFVKLPESQRFTVPRNFKLLAVPLCQILEKNKTYGAVISGVPLLLSKFSFNIVNLE